jgi:energy-coupling factor transporter ATP-binding protein EcfA2
VTRPLAQGDDRAPNGEGTQPLIYDRVTYAYRGGDTIVRDVSLALEEGKVVLVTGPSGAGKTTICRAANGLIPHEFKGTFGGKVTIAGRYDSRNLGVSSLSKIVGVLSQDPETQLFNPSVEDEIVFGACNYGLPVDTIRERTERLLDLTRLGHHRRKNPHNLSGGQQQACALASILAFEPLVLVLDEPTSNIDPIGSQQVLDLVARLAREENRTTLLVEHKIEELADLVDEMIVIDRGEILHRGTVREVLEHVEYIDSVGLSVPQVTLLCARLRTSGWSVEELPIGVEEAVRVLSPLIDPDALNRAP